MKQDIYFHTKLNFFLTFLYTLECWSRAAPECWAACFSGLGWLFFFQCVHVVCFREVIIKTLLLGKTVI